MKNSIYIVALIFCVACKNETPSQAIEFSQTEEKQTPIDLGQEIFEGKGMCYTCHKEDQKIIGPSMQEIAKIYTAQKGNMVAFLRGNEDPIVDPNNYETMKTNFAITKNLPEEELKALEVYILSFSK
jgi:cytochrome c